MLLAKGTLTDLILDFVVIKINTRTNKSVSFNEITTAIIHLLHTCVCCVLCRINNNNNTNKIFIRMFRSFGNCFYYVTFYWIFLGYKSPKIKIKFNLQES